jgi:hypothetical protein
MGANPLQEPFEGVGQENQVFFGPEMATRETHVHKITNVPVFLWRLGLMILMWTNPLLGPLEWMGPHQIHNVPPHINNRYANTGSQYSFVMQGDGGGSLHRPYRLRTRHLDWTRAEESQRQRTILLTLLDFSCSHLVPYHSNLGVRSVCFCGRFV